MSIKYCPNCGDKLKKRYTDCPNCGIDLTLEDEMSIFEDELDSDEIIDDDITESIPDISDDMPLLDDSDLW